MPLRMHTLCVRGCVCIRKCIFGPRASILACSRPRPASRLRTQAKSSPYSRTASAIGTGTVRMTRFLASGECCRTADSASLKSPRAMTSIGVSSSSAGCALRNHCFALPSEKPRPISALKRYAAWRIRSRRGSAAECRPWVHREMVFASGDPVSRATVSRPSRCDRVLVSSKSVIRKAASCAARNTSSILDFQAAAFSGPVCSSDPTLSYRDQPQARLSPVQAGRSQTPVSIAGTPRHCRLRRCRVF